MAGGKCSLAGQHGEAYYCIHRTGATSYSINTYQVAPIEKFH